MPMYLRRLHTIKRMHRRNNLQKKHYILGDTVLNFDTIREAKSSRPDYSPDQSPSSVYVGLMEACCVPLGLLSPWLIILPFFWFQRALPLTESCNTLYQVAYQYPLSRPTYLTTQHTTNKAQTLHFCQISISLKKFLVRITYMGLYMGLPIINERFSAPKSHFPARIQWTVRRDDHLPTFS